MIRQHFWRGNAELTLIDALQLQLNCEPGDIWCLRRQRQALLQWAYDSRKL